MSFSINKDRLKNFFYGTLNPISPFQHEKQESWRSEDVNRWQNNSRDLLKQCFLKFQGSQFTQYNFPEHHDNLLIRILFTLCKPSYYDENRDFIRPETEIRLGYHFKFQKKTNSQSQRQSQLPPEFLDSYSDEQKKLGETFYKKIVGVVRKNARRPKGPVTAHIGIIFIHCREENGLEYSLPIFSILDHGERVNSATSRRHYIDSTGRVYKNWKSWRENNTLPMMKYAIPKNGFYTTATEKVYQCNPEGKLDLIFENSPTCSFRSKILISVDKGSIYLCMVCAAVCLAPIAGFAVGPALLTMNTIGGVGLSGYNIARSAHRLYDKFEHKEEMLDMETLLISLSLIATPISMSQNFVARKARLLVDLHRTIGPRLAFLTNLTCFAAITANGFYLTASLVNLFIKYDKNQLTTGDFLQVAISSFFFANTVIKPQTIGRIVRTAHMQKLEKFSSKAPIESKELFKKDFMTNYDNSSRAERIKIVQNLEHIADPDRVFQKASLVTKPGGRKCTDLAVKDSKKPNPDLVKTLNGIEIADKEVAKLCAESASKQTTELAKRLNINDSNMTNLLASLVKNSRIFYDNFNKEYHNNKTKIEMIIHALLENLYDEDYLKNEVAKDIKRAEEIAQSKNVFFNQNFLLYLYFKTYGEEFISKLQEESILIYLEHTIENYASEFIDGLAHAFRVDDIENIVQEYTAVNTGTLTVTFKNFSRTNFRDHRDDERILKEEIRKYFADETLLKVVNDLPRLVSNTRGFRSTDTEFYSQIPIKVFVPGTEESFNLRRIIQLDHSVPSSAS